MLSFGLMLCACAHMGACMRTYVLVRMCACTRMRMQMQMRMHFNVDADADAF